MLFKEPPPNLLSFPNRDIQSLMYLYRMYHEKTEITSVTVYYIHTIA